MIWLLKINHLFLYFFYSCPSLWVNGIILKQIMPCLLVLDETNTHAEQKHWNSPFICAALPLKFCEIEFVPCQSQVTMKYSFIQIIRRVGNHWLSVTPQNTIGNPFDKEFRPGYPVKIRVMIESKDSVFGKPEITSETQFSRITLWKETE